MPALKSDSYGKKFTFFHAAFNVAFREHPIAKPVDFQQSIR